MIGEESSDGEIFTPPDILDAALALTTQSFINAVMSYRNTQKQIMNEKEKATDFPYTSVNINVINAGLATNIIPSKVSLVVDMRLAPDADIAEMDAIVNSWLLTTGNTTELTYYRKETESGVTSVDDSNPYWASMRDTLNGMGIELEPIVCPATSDSLKIRNLGIPAIGFSTKRRTISHLHGNDEYQNVEIFLEGIKIYTEIIKNLANVPCETNKL